MMQEGIPAPKGLMLNVGRKVISNKLFFRLVKVADKSWVLILNRIIGLNDCNSSEIQYFS